MNNRYASIDVGTNSIRCLLVEIENGKIVKAEKDLEMTRIGEGVNETKLLKMDRMASSVEAIDRFVKAADAFGAEAVFIMATSAVRDAHNRDVFLEAVHKKTGHKIEVISGQQEAEIGFEGVMAGVNHPSHMKLVVDIGGGSTEFIIGNQDGIQFSKSINVGAVRMTNMFGNDFKSMLAHVEHEISDVVERIKAEKRFDLIGIGGTATTFLTMARKIDDYRRELVHNQEIRIDEIQALMEALRTKNLEEKRKVIGLAPKRADIIDAGGVILNCIMTSIHSEKMIISDFDNLEGYLFHCLKQSI